MGSHERIDESIKENNTVVAFVPAKRRKIYYDALAILDFFLISIKIRK